MTSLQPYRPDVSQQPADLISACLPAGTPDDLLTRLADTLSVEALFVRRLNWPLCLGAVRSSDGSFASVLVEAHEVSDSCRAVGPAMILGGHEAIDEAACELLARQIQTLDARLLDEKLASMAELAAGAGHEVNNPLGSIVGRATLLAKEEPDPQKRKTLAAIVAQAYRGRDMIGDLMLFARPPAPLPEVVAVDPAFSEVAAESTKELELRELSLAGDRDPSVSVWADATQIRVVLSELLNNSIRFASEGSTIEVSVQCDGGFAIVTFVDDGPTLPDQDRRHLFDPFYSGRQAGRGLGFGLSKCWRITTLHGGSITFDDVSGKNRCSVRWPTTAGAIELGDQR